MCKRCSFSSLHRIKVKYISGRELHEPPLKVNALESSSLWQVLLTGRGGEQMGAVCTRQGAQPLKTSEQ